MITHHYELKDEDLESFKMYLDQLNRYYNASLLRFYGVSHRPPNHFAVILDYKAKSIEKMLKNCEFIDEMQVATIILQILYGVSFLHTHD
jgi:serine/threonine protein kinase